MCTVLDDFHQGAAAHVSLEMYGLMGAVLVSGEDVALA
jgi:hypothetical protein